MKQCHRAVKRFRRKESGSRFNLQDASSQGFSLIELLIVVLIIGVLVAIAIPQLSGSRRAIQAAELPKQIVAQLRYARQEAMSRRRAFTFVYDNAAKTVKIVGHTGAGPDNLYGTGDDILAPKAADVDTTTGRVISPAVIIAGKSVMADTSFPFNGQTVRTIALTGADFTAADLIYNQISGARNLSDGALRAAPNTSNLVTVTFQPDGTVINSASGAPEDKALFFYNQKNPKTTASAVSILGGGGRVKFWRYNADANAYED